MSELSAQRGATSEDLIKRREFRERLFHWEDSNKQRPACVSVHMCDSLLPLCSGKKKALPATLLCKRLSVFGRGCVQRWAWGSAASGRYTTTSVSPCVALWPPAVLTPGSASRSSPAGGGWSRPQPCVRRSSTRLLLWTGPSGCPPTCPRTRRRTSRRRSWWACSRPTQRWRRRAAGRSSPGRRKLHLVIRVKENNGGTAGERRRGTKHQVSPESKTSVWGCRNHYFTFDVAGGGMWPSMDFLFCFKICEQELRSIVSTIDNFTPLYFKKKL